MDLIPILMDLMGQKPLPGSQGRSLLEIEEGDAPPVFAEWRDFRLLLSRHQAIPSDFQISVQSGNSKLVKHLRNGLPRGLAGVENIDIDDKSLEMLRSLGYVL